MRYIPITAQPNHKKKRWNANNNDVSKVITVLFYSLPYVFNNLVHLFEFIYKI